MTTHDIQSLVTNRQPFLMLKTYDKSPLTGDKTRYEIIPLWRLESFTTAKIAGENAIGHLERYGADEISMADYMKWTDSGEMVCKRRCRDGEIHDFLGCLDKYHSFSTKWIRENITSLTR